MTAIMLSPQDAERITRSHGWRHPALDAKTRFHAPVWV